jgi:hypothetical protein
MTIFRSGNPVGDTLESVRNNNLLIYIGLKIVWEEICDNFFKKTEAGN